MSSDDDSDNELPGKKLGSDDDSPMGSPQRRENLSSPKSDDEEEKREETTIPVEIPKINTNLGENIHFVRFPNFLSVEPRPFDPEYYEDEVEEDDDLDEEGRTRLKLKVENTIRWRKQILEDGSEKVESNARIIKWSDGSQSLIVGNEKFDLKTMPLTGDFNHLFIRQGTGLQGQAVFRTKLTFRPSSTNSLTHRKMMGRLAHRINHSVTKVKVIPIAGSDPNQERMKAMKEAEEKARAEQRREQAKQKMRERQIRKGISADYLEDNDDDDNSYSLNRIKDQYKRGYGNTPRRDYDSDDEPDRFNRRGSVHGIESSDEDDDGPGFGAKRQRHSSRDSNESSRSAPKPKRRVVHDSDESDADSDKDSDDNKDSDDSEKSTQSDSD